MNKTSSKSRSTGGTSRLTETQEASEFLLWARKNHFAISRVRVGDVEIDVAADLQVVPTAPSLASAPADENPYETFGGKALERLREETHAAGARASALIDDDEENDDEPGAPEPGS